MSEWWRLVSLSLLPSLLLSHSLSSSLTLTLSVSLLSSVSPSLSLSDPLQQFLREGEGRGNSEDEEDDDFQSVDDNYDDDFEEVPDEEEEEEEEEVVDEEDDIPDEVDSDFDLDGDEGGRSDLELSGNDDEDGGHGTDRDDFEMQERLAHRAAASDADDGSDGWGEEDNGAGRSHHTDGADNYATAAHPAGHEPLARQDRTHDAGQDDDDDMEAGTFISHPQIQVGWFFGLGLFRSWVPPHLSHRQAGRHAQTDRKTGR